MAVNCWVRPRGIDADAGVTAILTSAGGPTVNVVCPTTPFKVAVMVVLPWATLAAVPIVAGTLLIVATPGDVDAQVTAEVTFAVVPLLNVPVAVNCC